MLKLPTAIPQCKKATVRKELSVACIINKTFNIKTPRNQREKDKNYIKKKNG